MEQALLEILTTPSLVLPIISTQLLEKANVITKSAVTVESVDYILNKLAKQGAVCIKSVTIGEESGCEVISIETKILLDLYKNFINDNFDLTEEIKRKYKKLFEDDEMLEDSISNDLPDESEDSSDRKENNANADSDDIMVRI